MMPDYSQQLERLIAALSHKDPLPTWVVSIMSALLGSVVTILIGFWKERHDAKNRTKRIERAIYGELLLNYSSLFGTLATDFEFHRISDHQKPFEGMFSWNELENAKTHGDVLYDVPNFAAMRTLYKMFEAISSVKGGGEHVHGLAVDGVRNFETFFVQGTISQNLIVEMCATCAPNLITRFTALVEKKIEPGQRE